MFTRRFWALSLERAVKTFAQSLVAVLGVGGLGLFDAPWTVALSAAGMAALLSVLTSVGSLHVGEPSSPSVLPPRDTTAAPAAAPAQPAAAPATGV